MTDNTSAKTHLDDRGAYPHGSPERGKVSVVIPCYNQAQFLSEAIESVLSGTYQDFEVIVVNDGSEDDTEEVASAYVAEDPRVRLITQQNRGLAEARNRGLADAQGEYVVFLDADDLLLGNALELGTRVLEANPDCAFVSGEYRAVSADGSFFWSPYEPPPEKDSYLMLLQYCFGMPAVVMYKRWVFGEVGGFDGSVDAAADWDLYLRIARRFPIFHHGQVVAEYRQHGTSMNQNPALMLKSTITVLRSQQRYLGDDKRREEAYDIGLRSMQADYGVPLAENIRGALRQHDWARALGDLLIQARYYPLGLSLLFSQQRLDRARLARHLQVTEHKLDASKRRLRSIRKKRRNYPRRRRKLSNALEQERRVAVRLRRRKRRLARELGDLGLLAKDGPGMPLRRLTTKAGHLATRVASRLRKQQKMDPTVALLPWGDVYEDYLDAIGVSLDGFCTQMSGGYLFGYVDALERVGVRTVLVIWSRNVSKPERRMHVPTGATVWVLPPTRAHLTARRLYERLDATGGRWTRRLERPARLLAGYSAVTPRVLARVLREERCSALLVQEYEYPRFDMCLLLGKLMSLPVLATFQGGRPEKDVSLEGWMRKRTVPRANGLLIGPRKEASAVSARYGLPPEAITIVGNPIDVNEWKPGDRAAARETLSLPDDVPVACWHGRIEIRRKGLDILVKAWHQVCQERPEADLRLLLCGGGAGNARLRQLMEEAPLRGVHWHDEYTTDRTIVRRQLAATDVFVFPSRHEGFAVAPMEAMACGRAVVASDAPGVADLLAGGERAGGVVVPRKNPRALAKELGRLLDDRDLAARLGEAARRRIEERYSPEAIGSTLVSALHVAAPGRFPPPPAIKASELFAEGDSGGW
jgi:glycosyltransferase involved in cell wall biosynthesis